MPASHDGATVMRTLAFMVVRRLLGLVGPGSPPDAKDAEIAVLRPLAPEHTSSPQPSTVDVKTAPIWGEAPRSEP
jgi:hypothetical protein